MDIELVETNNGGDLVKNAKDLSIIDGFENFPYLAMFGGNVEESTPVTRFENQKAYDFWGNNLLWPGDSSIQFNSNTERALNTIPLTSEGRVLIEEAIQSDLEFMKPFANVIIKTEIIATDKIILGIRLLEPDNIQRKDFVYIWDATNLELTNRENIDRSKATKVSSKIFDFSFDDSFE